MTKIGVQISSVKKYLQTPEDVMESFKKCAEIGYKYIQIQWINPEVPMEAIHDALKESGLISMGTQDSYSNVIPRLDEIIRMNKLWGSRHVCIGGMGIEERFLTEEGCLGLAKEFNGIAAKLREHGMLLVFHPLASNFRKYGKKTSIDIIMENTDQDIQIGLDVFHIKAAGYDTVSWIHKVKGRMDLLHFKDFYIASSAKPTLTPVGSGMIEWDEIFEACRETAVPYCFAEQEDWEKDAFECLADSYKFIKSHDGFE
jgi:sugar phosphate isomerase/epimerase